MAAASTSKVGIGVTLPQSKLQVDGGIQMGTDDTAGANLLQLKRVLLGIKRML